MVQTGKVVLDDIIIHKVPLADASKMYEIINNKEDNCVKVVLKQIKFIMKVYIKIIACIGLISFSLISCKKDSHEGNDPMESTPIMEQDKTNSETLHTHVPDSDTTNISPDSTQASPASISKP